MNEDNNRELRLEKFAINQKVLDKYGIEFSIKELSEFPFIHKSPNDIIIVVKSSKILYLDSFLYYFFPTNLEELIEEMNNAMNNEEFDQEVWQNVTGTSFLEIGPINSNFNSKMIPTNDLREIFASYVYWIDSNNYEKYI